MNRNRFMFIAAIISLLPLLLPAQKIDSMMRVYADNYPQEKIYVQFDKNVYNPGETIWFKAYVFSGIEPSSISKNFYAELTDASGNILQRKVEPLFESTAAGSFEIPANFKGSKMHFRAYTAWMLNFDTAFIFEKDIRLPVPVKDSSGISKSESHLQFFPEGGDLVATVENNIAFMATDPHGLPVTVNGTLKDASGKDVLEFNSVHDGMGKFLLSPDKGDVFYAIWKDEKGVEHKTDFPAVKPEGVALRVMGGHKKVFFSVARSSGDVPQYNRLTVIAHMNQQMIYKAFVNLKDNFMSGGSIPVDQLPSGVLQITVFDVNDLPIAERVIFVNNHAYSFSPEISFSLKSLAKRGKNVIDIDVPDSLQSNFSIAVTDADADGISSKQDNIISRLLLTGDLRGYVHDAGYYFSNSSDSLAQQLDLVMLTHGWRRFQWDLLLAGKTPVIKHPVENYLSINAEVLGVDASRIAADENLNVILQKKDSSIQMYNMPRIRGNKFGMSGLMFYDTVRAFYQFNVNRKLSNESAVIFNNGLMKGDRKIRLPSSFNPGWTAEDSAMLKRNRFIEAEVAKIESFDQKKVQTLESVTVKAREKSLEQKMDEQYTSGLFSGGDAYTFDLVDDPIADAFPDIFTYLQGRVAGLQITTNAGSTTMQWRGGSPSVYLNEMQVDVQQIRDIPVSDVAMVKVFRPGSNIGFGGGSGGTIAVYTKKGTEKRADPNIKGLDQARIIGYSVSRQFYSPDYEFRTDLNVTEDVRSTLYWNPYVLTDKNTRRATVQFFNNDISKRLRIVLEGFDTDGKLARVEEIIQ